MFSYLEVDFSGDINLDEIYLVLGFKLDAFFELTSILD
jgi:hypothetical protein